MNEEIEQVIAEASAQLEDREGVEIAAWASGAAYAAWLVFQGTEMPEHMVLPLVEMAYELEFWRRDMMR